MALPAHFLDELRARTPIAAVIGRRVKLSRSGKEQKGCCPFHAEKTPSFYVYDDGFHCFGCGAHGDVFTFIMKSTGAGFMEVVENLAAEAGMAVPAMSPQAAQAERAKAGIGEVLEEAAALYRRWLFESQGRAALDYLTGRGLTKETIQKFGLGWSGEGRGQLAGALRTRDISPDQLIEAGLMKESDRGPVDMFFARVMFPIADRRGHLISFGGRIMGDGQPKYVNGPETAAFSKRRSLYGLNFARDAVRQGAALIVAEGYMDVIALHQAGFTGAVAPLGTALTEEQLAELWRLSPEPVLCFDADAAGRRAALKTADLALAGLAPDRGLKFCALPEKDDPDSLIRRDGAPAFAARLKAAQPLSATLYDMLAAGQPRTTPEARAALRHRLTEIAAKIPDKALGSEYRAMLLDRFFAERRGPVRAKPPAARPALPDADIADERRARLLLATLLGHPALIPDVEEAFAHIPLPEAMARVRDGVADFAAREKKLDRESLLTHLLRLGLAEQARLIESQAAQDYRALEDDSLAAAAQRWWGWYNLMDDSLNRLRAQCDEQQRALAVNPDDTAALARLIRYTELLLAAKSGEFGIADP
jgi:DNA primase